MPSFPRLVLRPSTLFVITLATSSTYSFPNGSKNLPCIPATSLAPQDKCPSSRKLFAISNDSLQVLLPLPLGFAADAKLKCHPRCCWAVRKRPGVRNALCCPRPGLPEDVRIVKREVPLRNRVEVATSWFWMVIKSSLCRWRGRWGLAIETRSLASSSTRSAPFLV